MPTVELVVLALVVAALVVFRLWMGPSKPDGNAGRALEHIADADDGDIVSILGTVERAEAILQSPLTARPCVGYNVILEAGGRPVVEESRVVDFRLEDATGTALVRSEGALMLLVDPQTGSVGDSFADIESLLARHEAGATMDRTMRYREAIVKPGDQVIVTGFGRWEPLPNGAERRLVLESTPETPLRVTDDLPTQRV